MSKIRHWLVTAHETDCEDETHYVLAASAIQAENRVKAYIRKRRRADNEKPEEIYASLVVELPGPPLRIYMESQVVVGPKPINEIT